VQRLLRHSAPDRSERRDIALLLARSGCVGATGRSCCRGAQELQLELLHARSRCPRSLGGHARRLRALHIRVPWQGDASKRKKCKASAEHVVARRERCDVEVWRRKSQRAGRILRALRRSAQPPHCAALFQRLWAEQGEWLCGELDARWLVSAVTTFGDHGTTEAQRRVGQSLSVLFGTMKLYETERLYSGYAPDAPYPVGKRAAKRLPLDMAAYAIGGGGLDVNMLGRLWLDSDADPVLGPLARHLLDMLIHDPGGVFRRLRDDGTMGQLQDKWFGLRMEIPDTGYLPPGSI
jgi:hypothetical protein